MSMSGDMAPTEISESDRLQHEVAKLKKINAVLMRRVQQSTDQQVSAYSIFQTAIALEGQVRGRTEDLKNALLRLELANKDLLTARDAAERANRFKTRFFTAVGHDLLQPLHAARLSVSALTNPEVTPYQARLVNAIDHALATIEELLTPILDISKLEAGVITPTLRPIDLDSLFHSLAVDMEPLARTKNLALSWQSNSLWVTSDPLMLRRMLQNLLANAVQYTQQGEINLIACWHGDKIKIEVSDTGPGIPLAERKMIFEEFQRGPATDQPAIGGFGLGLSIVERMAEALGHPFSLWSELGHGTRFSIIVPSVAKVCSGTKKSEAADRARSHGLVGAKVLVIDNDDHVLEAMQALLERWSCEVQALRSLSELDSVTSSQSFRPDIVLADYHLDQGENGLAAVKRLRQIINPRLPAVMVTADRSTAVSLKASRGGCELLLKPIKPAELRALMAHLLG